MLPRTSNFIRIAAAVLALASAPLAAQEEEAADTVQLRFGWRPGMRADVEMEQVRIREMDGRRDSVRFASTYRVEVAEHPDGLAVTYEDMRWTELPDVQPELGRLFQAMAGTSSGGRARSIVSAGGEFVRVEGVEEVAREIEAALEPLFSEVEAVGLANLRQMLAGMISPEALGASAADEWNALVGAWLDADLEVGGVYELESTFQSPAFPGVDIPVTMEFRLVDWTPCTEADAAEPRCVELVMGSVPDAQAVAEAVRGFLAQAGLPMDQAEALFAQMAVETWVTLVTEPGTLRPHVMEIQRAVSMGEEEDAPLQIDSRTFVYRYTP